MLSPPQLSLELSQSNILHLDQIWIFTSFSFKRRQNVKNEKREASSQIYYPLHSAPSALNAQIKGVNLCGWLWTATKIRATVKKKRVRGSDDRRSYKQRIRGNFQKRYIRARHKKTIVAFRSQDLSAPPYKNADASALQQDNEKYQTTSFSPSWSRTGLKMKNAIFYLCIFLKY